MALIKEKRKHIFSEADLIGLARKISGSLRMYLPDLQSFGISQTNIDTLDVLSNEFSAITKDIERKSDLINATQNKNQLAEIIKEEIRMLTLRCKLKWGNNSLEVKALGIKGMEKFSDRELLFASNRVHSFMTENLPALVEFGLSQSHIDNFEVMKKSFENAMILQKNIINLRESDTNTRVKLSNELFSQIQKYAELGKRVFVMTNEAKYNDFIIYHRRKSKKRLNKNEDVVMEEKKDI